MLLHLFRLTIYTDLSGLARRFLFAIGLCWLGLVACSTPPTPAPPTEIRLGLISSFTGEFAASIGEPDRNAAQLAVQAVNEAGGLLVNGERYPVTLVMGDDQGYPEDALRAAQRLINQENVVALVGPQFSRLAIPVARFAENSRLPMISPTSTNPETTANKHYIFRATFLDSVQGQVLAQFAFNELGARRAAVLYDDASAYNRDLASYFRTTFEKQGGAVVAYEAYITGAPDLSAQLERLQTSQPDLIFLPNYETEVPRQAQLIRAQGLTAPLLGGDAWGSIEPTQRANLDGSYFTVSYAVDLDTAENRAFVAAYRAAYQTDPLPTAASTYDALHLLFQAIQSEGRFDPEAIRLGLTRIKQYSGVTGQIRYDGGGDPLKSVVLMRIQNSEFNLEKIIAPAAP